MNFRLLIGSAIVLAAASGCSHPNAMPNAVWNVLEHADRYELLSIDPDFGHGQGGSPATQLTTTATKPETLSGFIVLGTLPIEDAKQRQRLNDALRKSMNDWPHLYSMCMFQPRHALRATMRHNEVEILICFHCGDLKYAGNGTSGFAHVNMETPGIFNDLLKAAKIPQDSGA